MKISFVHTPRDQTVDSTGMKAGRFSGLRQTLLILIGNVAS